MPNQIIQSGYIPGQSIQFSTEQQSRFIPSIPGPTMQQGSPQQSGSLQGPTMQCGFPHHSGSLPGPTMQSGFSLQSGSLPGPTMQHGFPQRNGSLLGPTMQSCSPQQSISLPGPTMQHGMPQQSGSLPGPTMKHGMPQLSGSIQELSFPETGRNKIPLVKVEEYQRNFAHSSEYCKPGGNWPHTTILLYKYSSNGNTKYEKVPENTWKKEDNIKAGKHAEQIMIEDLESIQKFLKKQPYYYEGSYKGINSIEVISSYSPCSECSDRLCAMKHDLEEEVKNRKKANSINIDSPETEDLEDLARMFGNLTTGDINFFITFSTFYYHDKPKNEKGLIKLLKNDIKLDTFKDDNWQYFFDAAGLSSAIQSKEEHLVTKRQEREEDDSKLLQYFKLSVALDPIIHYCKERGIKLAKHMEYRRNCFGGFYST